MAATNLSNRDVKLLFQSWGFEPGAGNGGHLRMRLFISRDEDGTPKFRTVQISAPGRQDRTPMRALHKGAAAVGVSLRDFLTGPPTSRAVRAAKVNGNGSHPQIGDTFVGRQEEEVEAEAKPAIPAWRAEHARPSTRVEARLRAAPRLTFTKDSIARDCEITPSQAAQALVYVERTRAEITRVGHGVYMFDDAAQREAREAQAKAQAAEEARAAAIALADAEAAQRAETEKAHSEHLAAIAALENYTQICVDRHGRVLLTDHEGEFWLAVRVEPHHHAMT
jgi:hypothetical protein